MVDSCCCLIPLHGFLDLEFPVPLTQIVPILTRHPERQLLLIHSKARSSRISTHRRTNKSSHTILSLGWAGWSDKRGHRKPHSFSTSASTNKYFTHTHTHTKWNPVPRAPRLFLEFHGLVG